MTKPRIYYTRPSITELEVEYAARNGWGDFCYEYINRFEDAFNEHLEYLIISPQLG